MKVTQTDIKKAQKCPPGMHIFTLNNVEEPYYNEKGTEVQKCDFESDKGYIVSFWFNDKFMANMIEFVEAADNVKLNPEEDPGFEININLRDYQGKRVAGSVSHIKDKNNKIQAQIDNFFSADKVPF